MSDFFVILRLVIAIVITLFIGLSAWFYVVPIIRRDPKAQPVLATWILFGVALSLSLLTYFDAPKHDVLTNFGSILDTVRVFGLLLLLYVMGHRTIEFTKLQFGCLIGSGITACFWLQTDEAAISNVLTQLIIAIGYLPTYERLWRSNRNTEPLKSWFFSGAASVLAIALGIIDHDVLVVIYGGRALVQVSLVLLLILRIERRAKRS